VSLRSLAFRISSPQRWPLAFRQERPAFAVILSDDLRDLKFE